MASHFSTQQVSGHTPSVDEVIAAIARVQHGLVTLIQLLRAGLVHSQITRRVNAGRLHRIHTSVYAVGHADLSREARPLQEGDDEREDGKRRDEGTVSEARAQGREDTRGVAARLL